MTNEEIMAAFAIIDKQKVREKPKTETIPEPARPLTKAGKVSAFTYDELGDKPLSGKGHVGYFKGKPIDKEKFAKAVSTFLTCSSMHKTYKMSGLSEPTYQKRVKQLINDGELPGYLFTDGKPLMVTDLKPLSELEIIQVELTKRRRGQHGRKYAKNSK
jgi:hypothetical protein